MKKFYVAIIACVMSLEVVFAASGDSKSVTKTTFRAVKTGKVSSDSCDYNMYGCVFDNDKYKLVVSLYGGGTSTRVSGTKKELNYGSSCNVNYHVNNYNSVYLKLEGSGMAMGTGRVTAR